MAKRVVDEEMRFTVVINGDAGKKELYDLEKRNRSLTASNKDLRAEQAKLVAQGKKNTVEYKNLTAEIKQNNTELKTNKSRMKVLQDQIGVTGLTMRQLQQRASQLRLQLNNMVPGSAPYKRLENDLKQVNTQLTKLRLNARASESAMTKVANGFNKYAALGASVIATGTGIVLTFQEMIDFNGKLSDAQSAVQKTTELTKEETRELTKEFGLLKTRTARIELLKLAEEAGRLGQRGKKNIQEFVASANMIKLALGDDLSDEQIREVGKIAKIYKVGEQNNLNYAKSFESVGSAINEVSASGENMAPFLVDFLKRTGGISDIANITAQDMIGLAAAFDEVGQSQEISATAINKTFGSMGENAEKFANIAGIGVKEFSQLLREDANEALILFLEGLNKGNPSLEEMEERLKGIELGGTRGKQALAALAADIDNVRKKQEIANDALLKNESLTKEAMLRETNFAAILEKVSRRIRGIFADESVVNGLTAFVTWFGKFIGAVEDGDGTVTVFRNRLVALLKTFLIITAAIVSYRVAVQLAALWTGRLDKTSKLYIVTQRIQIASTKVLRTLSLLMSAAYALMTGNIVRARAALALLNATMLLSPIGLIAAAIAAIGVAYLVFSDSAEEAASSQSLLNKAIAESTKNTAAEISQKKIWLKIAQDENSTRAEKQYAVEKLNETVAEYNNQLTIETANTAEATKKLNEHIEAIKRASMATALKAMLDKKSQELVEAQNQTLDDSIKWYEAAWVAIKNGGNAAGYVADVTKQAVKNKYELVDATQAEIDKLAELYEQQLRTNANAGGGNTPAGTQEGDTKYIDGVKYVFQNGTWKKVAAFKPVGDKDDKTESKRLEQQKREAAALLKLQRETEDARIALIEDSFAREMAQADANFKRKMQDLQTQSDEVLNAYDKAIDAGDTDLASVLLKQYNELYDQIEMLGDEHQSNQNKILEAGIQDRIDSLKSEFEREEQERQTAHNNAIAALGNNEEAKKRLQEQFDKETLERQKANQQALIDELKNIVDIDKFEGFSLDLLSEEQLQALKDRLATLGLSLSEINKLLSAMQKGDQSGIDELAGLGIDGGSKVDILGMNDEQWNQLFSRTETLAGLIGKVGKIAQATAQAYSIYDQFVTQGENKKLQAFENASRTEIQKQGRLLDSKLISRKQHNDAVENAEKKLAKQKAEIEYKQAKREKAMNIATILGNQAVAISKALAQGGFVLGIPWAGIVAAFAGLQLAAAIAAPLPAKGFEKGYYGNTMQVRREQDGKLFNAGFGGQSRSGVVDKPTVFLAGEGGKNFPELIINGPDLKQLNPDLKNSLYRELGRVPGFEKGYYPKPSNEDVTDSYSSEERKMLIIALNRNSEVLERIESNGLTAVMSKDMTNIKKFRDEMQRLEKIERKSTIIS
ncbi:phage tail tape measure protein [Sediminibacter sp. Hel_I_10]|uniref:phage tail tape measure protein n=1 Tax=Sediminibacter sp. Hel_I_10 TaxID=1392490 RepID=UPI00047B9900|nr:phage tail tape measure protein [Sediminibacter sp. Hel_I_10]